MKDGSITVKDIGVEDKLCVFIEEIAEDLCSLELLLFFSRHPQARFNRTAVLHSINGKRFDAAISLNLLIDKKLVVTYLENGLTLYALTKEEPAHSLAVQLINIDQSQWQAILEHILDANGI
jgi:hypothetical protein